MYRFTKTALIASVLAVSVNITFGQTNDEVALIAEKPRCVLVQLPSESNRLTMLTRSRRTRDVDIVKADAERTREATMRDFTENFDFCPVYFYVDTNVQKIKDRNFEGTLIDTAGNLVIKPVLNANSKDYLVVYFGLGNVVKIGWFFVIEKCFIAALI